VIISGTGSVAFGRNESGQEARAGGWGPTIGDEGSGYAIARDGLSAIVRAHDGRGRKTKMTELLCYDYDMCSPEDLPRFVYATTTHADDIARYGKLVIESARLGDEVAIEILERAGRELAECVLAVARRLALTSEQFPVAYVGGVFNADDVILGPMRNVVKKEAAKATLNPPKNTPVEGAAMMAIRSSQHPRPERRP